MVMGMGITIHLGHNHVNSPDRGIKLMKKNSLLTATIAIILIGLTYISFFQSMRAISAPTLLNDNITAWTTTEVLPQTLTFQQAVIQGKFIYVSGGRNANELVNQVYSAEIKSDGQLTKWQPLSLLPTKLYQHAMVATDQYLYVIGGWDANNSRNDVWRARRLDDGKINPWESVASPYPTSIYLHDAVIVNGRIYVLGGVKNRTERTNEVYYTTINSDGSLGSWQLGPSLSSTALYRAAVVATADTIYVTGGWDGTKALNTVYYSKVNNDGSLAAWQEGKLPKDTGRYYHEALLFDSKLFILGGTTDGTSESNEVYAAPIQSDGSLGAWTTESALPKALQRFAAASGKMNGKFFNFVLGGQSATVFQNQVYGSSFTPLAPTPTPTPTPALKAFLENNPPRYAGSGEEITYRITYSTVHFSAGGANLFSNIRISNTIPEVDNIQLEPKNISPPGQQIGNKVVWQISDITKDTKAEVSYVVKLPDNFQSSPTPPPTPFVANLGAEVSWSYNGKTYITTTNAVFNNSPVLYLPFLPKDASLATPTATP